MDHVCTMLMDVWTVYVLCNIMYGLCGEFVWTMYGLCRDFVLILYGLLMNYVWIMYNIMYRFMMDHV